MFVVNTNVAKSDVPAVLLSEATNELAKAMGKPAQVGQVLAYLDAPLGTCIETVYLYRVIR